jgi:hypothetical protein
MRDTVAEQLRCRVFDEEKMEDRRLARLDES